ncbi:MAG: ribosome biosis GTPase / thiamine phosphate phosphatase [Gaiellaceae bacterium]|nr:ribosome biosis GTPase / thiamine phosphate phosphatase [Gaiellaceae bacterium]
MHDQLSALGFDVERTAELAQLGSNLVPARVTRVDRGAVTVATADNAELRLAADDLAVGDWIALDGTSVQARLQRRSALVRNAGDTTRAAMAEEARVVAANVDVVLVVRALDMPVRPGRVQQLVALAYASGADVAFVLTKADCHDHVARAIYEIELVAPGISVLAVSAVTGDGINELVTLIHGRTFVLLGESGAGKSTLVNRLAGEELLATAEVQRGGAGRHTTTHRQLVVLEGVGVAIDTPGVRTAGFWGTAADVSKAFADIEELATQCRFADCAHGSEPGCAVRGVAAPERLEAYEHTLREQRALEVRLDPRLASERRKQRRTQARSYRRDSWR